MKIDRPLLPNELPPQTFQHIFYEEDPELEYCFIQDCNFERESLHRARLNKVIIKNGVFCQTDFEQMDFLILKCVCK